MLQPVGVGHKALADYTHLAGRPLIEEIRELAEDLRGLKVLHLSATAFGGGVSEILYTLVPLMRDVGIDADWQIIFGREEFFNATKLMHNALQGNPQDLSPEEWSTWERYNELNAKQLQAGWDVIIVHDPQPAGVHQHVPEKAQSWVWRCHIDLSTPNPGTIERLTPLVQEHDAFLFHMEQYVPAGLNGKRPPYIVPPAIDPLSPKNMALSPEDAAFVCDQFGIDVDRPLICQVSRFDPWKDPIGVIDAYRARHGRDARRAARADRLDGDGRPRGLGLLQLDDGARAGRPRHQDPQQPEQRRRDRGERVPVAGRRRDPEVHPRGLRPDRLRGALEGAAVHRRRRGRDPAAGRPGRDGLPRLVARGVRSARDRVPAATRSSGGSSGARGKEHVRTHFLTPRLLRDWLRIFKDLK